MEKSRFTLVELLEKVTEFLKYDPKAMFKFTSVLRVIQELGLNDENNEWLIYVGDMLVEVYNARSRENRLDLLDQLFSSLTSKRTEGTAQIVNIFVVSEEEGFKVYQNLDGDVSCFGIEDISNFNLDIAGASIIFNEIN